MTILTAKTLKKSEQGSEKLLIYFLNKLVIQDSHPKYSMNVSELKESGAHFSTLIEIKRELNDSKSRQ